MRRVATIVAVTGLMACGPGQPPSSAASSGRHTASSSQEAAPYAVLVSGVQAGDTPTYTASIVSTNGNVVSYATAANPNSQSAPWQPLPLVSTSASRVYYLDGRHSVKFLKPDGTTGLALQLPVQSDERGVFAVSADDSKIAVSVFNLKSGMRLMIANIAASPTWHQVFATTAFSEWPVGWRGNELVLAVGYVSGGQQTCAICYLKPIGYHIADADTGARSATVCSGTSSQSQVPSGPPAPAGVICETATKLGQNGQWTESSLAIARWDGSTLPVRPPSCVISSAGPLALSPDGQRFAGERNVAACVPGTTIYVFDDGGQDHGTAAVTTSYPWVLWIDAGHFCYGTDRDQSNILEVAANKISAVRATGLCLATIPGGLGN